LNDTETKIEEIYEKMLLARSGAERMRMVSSMHATAKALVMASLREKCPCAPEAQLRGLLFLRFYGNDFPSEERDRIYQHLACNSE
jgi:hypothetical protein